jgi:hypothetical protein
VNRAAKQKLLPNAPKITMPKIPKGTEAKGRPITAEEFERMVEASVKIVGKKNAGEWLFLLRGSCRR